MDTQTKGECLVCGAETNSRCSGCVRAGVDLFFCSPEHQKLVWPGHRLFCSDKAFPIYLPPLTPAERSTLLTHFDTRGQGIDDSNAGGGGQTTLLGYLQTMLAPARRKREIIEFIECSTAGCELSKLDLFQMDLVSFRMALVSFKTGNKTWQTELLGVLSFLIMELNDFDLLRGPIPRFDLRQANLFHRLVCHQVLVKAQLAALKSPEVTMNDLEPLTKRQQTSREVVRAFAARHFGDGKADQVSEVLEKYTKKVPQ